jgi:hypothetical protein
MFLFHMQLIAGGLEGAKIETYSPQGNWKEGDFLFSFCSEKYFFYLTHFFPPQVALSI